MTPVTSLSQSYLGQREVKSGFRQFLTDISADTETKHGDAGMVQSRLARDGPTETHQS